MHIPPIRGTAPVGSSPDPSNDPAFINLIDSAWIACQMLAGQNGQQATNTQFFTQIFMQTVNNLMAYFKQHGTPPPGTQAWDVYQQLTYDYGGGNTIASECSTFGGDYSKVTAAVGWLQTGVFSPGASGSPSFEPLYNALNEFHDNPSIFKDGGEQKVANLVGYFYDQLQYFMAGTISSEELGSSIINLDTALNQLPQPLDGYLQVIKLALETPCNLGGTSEDESLLISAQNKEWGHLNNILVDWYPIHPSNPPQYMPQDGNSLLGLLYMAYKTESTNSEGNWWGLQPPEPWTPPS